MNKKLAIYFSGLIVLTACSGFEKVLKSNDYTLKYKEAKRYYAEENYYRAQTLLDQIAPVYRGTLQADSVYYMQAMSYFKQDDYIMAGHYFSMFAQTYGGSPYVEEADYMTAYCYYMTSPRPELDQDNSLLAIQSFQLFDIKYPNSPRVAEAKNYINELQEKLVEKAFLSAKLYFDLEDYKASVVALNNCLIEYPESNHREQIMFMILKSSFMMAEKSIVSKKKERYQQTIDEYYSFKAEFPESKQMKDADRYYKNSSKFLGGDIQQDDTEKLN
jgi:outer membrane protein assembly factor BamD